MVCELYIVNYISVKLLPKKCCPRFGQWVPLWAGSHFYLTCPSIVNFRLGKTKTETETKQQETPPKKCIYKIIHERKEKQPGGGQWVSEDMWLLSPDSPEDSLSWETLGPAGLPLLTLHCVSSPLRMTTLLLISLVSCLVAVNQASLINRCDLANVLHQEDLDGFEGYSLSDCEYRFFTHSHPFSPPLPVMPSVAIFLFLSFVFQSQVQKVALSKKPFPTFDICSTILNWALIMSQELL